jgi:hypothetical protein
MNEHPNQGVRERKKVGDTLVYVKVLSRIWLVVTEQNWEFFGQRRFNKWTLIIQTLRYTNPLDKNTWTSHSGMHRTTLLPHYYTPNLFYEPRDIVPCIGNSAEQDRLTN